MKRRFLAVFAAACLLVSMVPATVFAQEGGLCEHHAQHNESCGYTEGTAEVPCSHAHTEQGYTSVTQCVHTHTEQ